MGEFFRFVALVVVTSFISRMASGIIPAVISIALSEYFLGRNAALILDGFILMSNFGSPATPESIVDASLIQRRYGRLFDIIGLALILGGIVRAIFF